MPENWEKTREHLLDRNYHKAFIASHRGRFGMTVMENTALAFQLAVREGADMVEMDISKTKDGVLVGFHDNDIFRMTGRRGKIWNRTYEELMGMELNSYMFEKNGAYLETFEEMITPLKGKTIIVLDKCWDYWDDVYAVLKKLGMEQQAIFKFYSSAKHLYGEVHKYPEVMFIPMHETEDDLDAILALKKECCLMGIEVLPKDKDDRGFTKEYMDMLHEHDLKVWCNSLSFCKRLIFGGGFDDLLSLREGGDAGWGELIRRGVDIIQTDWPHEVRQYLDETGH